jgi:hypothetical protein
VLNQPYFFLITEVIIPFAAFYNGYFYGLSFLFNSAFVIIVGPKGHEFGTIDVSLCFLGIDVGITIGPITNALFQEVLHIRDFLTNWT